MLPRIRAAERVLLALDFDGTLSPIADRPEDAVVPHATAHRLAVLGQRKGFSLLVVSGRSLSDLRSRLPMACPCAGNHGLEIEGFGLSFLHPEAERRRPELERAATAVEAALDGIDGALVERKGLSATVHYRRVAPCLHQSVRNAIAGAMRPYSDSFDVLPALKAWEVRPRVDWHKGTALRFILDHLGEPAPLVICAGDDDGDEPMFEAVPDAASIRVGKSRGVRRDIPSKSSRAGGVFRHAAA